ncbi:MAG: (Fe-S)-binding protein [Thermoplasmatota archaeon]
MPEVVIDRGACTGCGRGVKLCPANVLQLREKKAVVADAAACTLCGICGVQTCMAFAVGLLAGSRRLGDCEEAKTEGALKKLMEEAGYASAE